MTTAPAKRPRQSHLTFAGQHLEQVSVASAGFEAFPGEAALGGFSFWSSLNAMRRRRLRFSGPWPWRIADWSEAEVARSVVQHAVEFAHHIRRAGHAHFRSAPISIPKPNVNPPRSSNPAQ
jgi:hypothetical protein